MFERLGKKVAYIVENYMEFIFVLAALGIIFAVIGHYGTCGFNWKMFLFFELPLYLFLAWAIYASCQMYVEAKKMHDAMEKNKKKIEPKFKVGDWVRKGDIEDVIEHINENSYIVHTCQAFIPFSDQDNWEFVRHEEE